MLADTTGGMGAITFQHRRYNSADVQIEWIVEYSTNAGGSWVEAGRFTAGELVETFSASVNTAANGRVRIRTNAAGSTNRRANIDEFSITAYSPPTSPSVSASGNLSVLNSTYGSPSLTATSFTVSGGNLTQGILVDPPDGFEVSLAEDGASGFAATQTISGTDSIAPTTVFIRVAAGSPAGLYSGNIVCTSGAVSATLPMPEAEVRRKGLNITASNQNKPFGQTLLLGPGQTAFSAVGLVGGETVGSVTLAADGGTGAGDAVGNYAITPSAATGGSFAVANYNINYFPGVLTVIGQSFGDWGAGLSDPSPGADPDGNGLANLVEYFYGMQPGGDAAGATIIGAPTVTNFHMDYRRSKSLNGVTGGVAWRNDLTIGGWSTDSVVETIVSDHGAYEIRRATVPRLPGEAQKFLRLEVWEE